MGRGSAEGVAGRESVSRSRQNLAAEKYWMGGSTKAGAEKHQFTVLCGLVVQMGDDF